MSRDSASVSPAGNRFGEAPDGAIPGGAYSKAPAGNASKPLSDADKYTPPPGSRRARRTVSGNEPSSNVFTPAAVRAASVHRRNSESRAGPDGGPENSAFGHPSFRLTPHDGG